MLGISLYLLLEQITGFLVGVALEVLVHRAADHGLVEVHLVAVELRAVYAGEFRLAAHAQAAAAAHTRAVDHDGVHGHHGGDVVLAGELADELHHDDGADGDDPVILGTRVDLLLQQVGDQGLFAVGAVIGADDEIGGGGFELILEDEFEAASTNLIIGTDDGSYGKKALVTDLLKEQIEAGAKYDRVIAIGPVIMMKFVCLLTKEYGIPTVVSMNPIMIDGTGMCGGCRLSVGGETKFACVDGPEFDGHLVDFDEAMTRGAMYRDFELHAREETCNLFKQEVK